MRRYCCPHLCEESINCDVSNETDILVSHLGFAISIASGQLKDDLITIAQMLFDFMGDLRKSKSFEKRNVSAVEEMENKYKSKLKEKVVFVIPTGNELSSTLHICRAYAKKVARLYFKYEAEVKTENDDLSNFINVLSTTFYNMAKYVNQEENILEIEISRRNK